MHTDSVVDPGTRLDLFHSTPEAKAAYAHCLATDTPYLDSLVLAQNVTARRKARMLEVVAQRLSSVTIVLENIYDPHNASAIVRTAEGVGIDTVHVIEQPNTFEATRSITMGADRWVEIERDRDLLPTLGKLSGEGYLVCAADVGPGCVPLHALPADRPIAVIMGGEREGISPRAKAWCETRFTIPMAGFTESFNVSVSAAVILHALTTQRRAHLGVAGDLSDAERHTRLDAWLRRSVRNAEDIEALMAERAEQA